MLKHEIIGNDKEEWVVFIHGIGGNTKTWKRQTKKFSEKYNLLLLDLPGHGEDAANVIYKIDAAELNKEIADTLDYLKIPNAHFVGLSLGTMVIANFAVEKPSYIKSIILGGSVLSIKGIYRALMAIANGIKRLIPHRSLYKFFSWFMMPSKKQKKFRTIFLLGAIRMNKETMFAWIDYMAHSLRAGNLFRKLNAMCKHILFISGGEDHCFLRGCKWVARRITSAEIKIIEHCGHVCSLENSALFNKYALDYLATAV
jgi:pimeloyl-ACP methyl ester carboxylesterase